jgi:hypothetical protein
MISDEISEALRGDHQLGIFVYCAFSPQPLALWFGVNDIEMELGFLSIAGGVEFLGGGVLQGVPELEVLVNGIADRVEFTLAGIDPSSYERSDIESYTVRGAEVYVGITCLDDYYQPVAPIQPLWDGRASFVRESMPPVTGSESPTVQLLLSVGSGVTTRARSSASIWSAPHQRALYPTDAFCDGTARLARGVAPTFPRF